MGAHHIAVNHMVRTESLPEPEPALVVRRLGVCAYHPVWQAMQAFTRARTAHTADELWLLEHAPVFTLGLNARPEHLRDAAGIPVVRCDRGGQVTYHGPGQVVAYCLFDLRRLGIGVKTLVRQLEQSVIDVLADHALVGVRRSDAPGVYVEDAKIAALGLRITRGASYHGVSLNVAMDLSPYTRINPCGYEGLTVTQLSAAAPTVTTAGVGEELVTALQRNIFDVRT